MPLKITEVEFKAAMPKLPPRMPVMSVTAPTLDDRRRAITTLAERFRLGGMQQANLDHAMVMGNERGHIEYFHASGAVIARDAAAHQAATDEMRRWEGLKRADGPDRMTLAPAQARSLIAAATALMEPIDLLGKQHGTPAVKLEQVAQLDARGREIAFGAGRASVIWGYAIGGVPVGGAGAKSLVQFEPDGTAARALSAVHTWRPVGDATDIELPSIEAALAVGLLGDPELELYARAGHRVTITSLELMYLALPPFLRQSHLFPTFRVEGSVSEGPKGMAFDFGRVHHAAPPSAYLKAGLSGPSLLTNPDGIKPLPVKKRAA